MFLVDLRTNGFFCFFSFVYTDQMGEKHNIGRTTWVSSLMVVVSFLVICCFRDMCKLFRNEKLETLSC